MTKSIKAQIQAYVQERVRLHGQEPLPSVRQMAQSQGASTRTVHLVLKSLVAQGFLEVRRGVGYGPMGFRQGKPVTIEVSNPKFATQRVSDAITSDLQCGVLSATEPLPRLKDLAERYAISVPTLRKALQRLTQENTLTKLGSRWMLQVPVRHKSVRRRVRLLCSATAQGIRIESSREHDFVRSLVEESSNMGFDLEILGYEDRAQRPFFLTAQGEKRLRIPDMPGLVGTICSTWHMRDARNCLAQLASENQPISVWLESGEHAGIARRFKKASTAFFDLGYGIEPGVCVGKELLARGHQNVLYISPFHGSDWSREREEGLRTTLCAQGAQLRSLVQNEFQNSWTFRDQVLRATDWDALHGSLRHVYEASAGRLEAGDFQELPQPLVTLRDLTFDLVRNDAIAAELAPMFTAALRATGVSAWVLANDLCAVLAQNFLRTNEVPRAKWPLLVGFDNTPESYVRGLDSYAFNTRGMVQEMLYHLVAPKHTLFAQGQIIHLAGKVVRKFC